MNTVVRKLIVPQTECALLLQNVNIENSPGISCIRQAAAAAEPESRNKSSQDRKYQGPLQLLYVYGHRQVT